MRLFKNRQWAVTEYGLESKRPGAPYEYYIEASKLLKKSGDLYYWPCFIAEKPWIDIEAFIFAFAWALELHKGKFAEAVDPNILEATFVAAREKDNKLRPKRTAKKRQRFC